MIEVRLTPEISKEKEMVLIIPIMIIWTCIYFLLAIIAIAGGILMVVTEKIKKNPALTEEAKRLKTKKAKTTIIIIAAIIFSVALMITGLVAVGIFDILLKM